MKVCITRLGPVTSAEINLAPRLILFCGTNSTGKTYVSYALYAFLKTAAEAVPEMELPATLTPGHISLYLASLCEKVVKEAPEIFAGAKRSYEHFGLACEWDSIDMANCRRRNIFVSTGKCRISKPTGTLDIRVEGTPDAADIASFYRAAAFGDGYGARMLTVERNSMFTFRGQLDAAAPYPMAIRDSLRFASDLGRSRSHKGHFTALADEIERDLLRGELSLTADGGVEFRGPAMGKSAHIPFRLSSSLVKTMTDFVVYLRHLSAKGDTLIIDEPEMNFHPDAQVTLARFLARLVNSGIRLVVSTHSDYILREINNMIMARTLLRKGADTEEVSAMGYTEETSLSSRGVGAIMFDRTGRDVKALPISVGNRGFDVATIDRTINEQNHRAMLLFDYLDDLGQS